MPTIDGTVYDPNSNAQQGATVTIVDVDGQTIAAEETTDTNGAFSSTVADGPTYHVAAKYDDGSGNLYNSISEPFISTSETLTFDLTAYTVPANDAVDFSAESVGETITLSGSASGSGTTTGSTTRSRLTAGAPSSSGSTTATPVRGHTTTGTLTGSGAATGSQTRTRVSVGTASGAGALSGTPLRSQAITGPLSATATAVGAPTAAVAASGASVGSGSVAVTASASIGSSGSLSGSGTVDATPIRTQVTIGSLTAVGTTTGTSTISVAVTASPTGTGTVDATLTDVYTGPVSVSGTAQLDDGTLLEGATIRGINDTTDTEEAVVTTDANGDYTIEFPAGDEAHFLFEYDDGETQHQAESQPFIVPE